MFCNNCGQETPDGAEFCTNCGQKVGANTANTKVYTNQNVNNNATSGKTNGMAIAGFVCSFFFAILGLVFSIIGLNKAKQENSPKGLAIAGIVISAVSLFFTIIVYAVYGNMLMTYFATMGM